MRRSPSLALAPRARGRPSSRKVRVEHLDQSLGLGRRDPARFTHGGVQRQRSTTIVGPPPPPPTGNFSNASLNGQYAFLMSGTELCAGCSSFFTRVGSFTADGSGHISGGLEDVNMCSWGFHPAIYQQHVFHHCRWPWHPQPDEQHRRRQTTASRFLPRPKASLCRPT